MNVAPTTIPAPALPSYYSNYSTFGNDGEDSSDESFVVSDGHVSFEDDEIPVEDRNLLEKDIQLVNDEEDQAPKSKKTKRERTDAALSELTEKIMANQRRRQDEASGPMDKFLKPVSSGKSDVEEDSQPAKRTKYSRAARPRSLSNKNKKDTSSEIEFGATIERQIPKLIVKPEDFKLIGREAQVQQIIRMLSQPKGGMRPILMGPKGIGKKSTIKIAGYKIARGECPDCLKNKRIIMIDCQLLLGNSPTTSGKDEIGAQLQYIVGKIHPKAIIYFKHIDKILYADHVSEYLKALLDTDLKFIASVDCEPGSEDALKCMTALRGYNFFQIDIGEFSKEVAMQVVKIKLAKHPLHPGLELSDEGLKVAVELSSEYIKHRPLHLKTLNLIRTAASAVWDSHKDKEDKKAPTVIDPLSVAKIVEAYSQVPAEDLVANPFDRLLKIESNLKAQIIGQDAAVETVYEEIFNCKIGNAQPNKPWAAYLFVGPTGVGKTELAKCVVDELFRDRRGLFRINGSEYSESHSIAKLIGSPAGYVGHDEGGQLSEALKNKSHMVILFDEIEKAHKDVHKLFLQIIDEGEFTDSFGVTIDCKNTLIIMTSNEGSQELVSYLNKNEVNGEEIVNFIKPFLIKKFSPEFCGRLTSIVPFMPLRNEHVPQVIQVHLKRIAKNYQKDPEKGLKLTWDKGVVTYFVKSEFDPKFGMRDLCNSVYKTVRSALSAASKASRQPLVGKAHLKVQDGKIIAKLNGK